MVQTVRCQHHDNPQSFNKTAQKTRNGIAFQGDGIMNPSSQSPVVSPEHPATGFPTVGNEPSFADQLEPTKCWAAWIVSEERWSTSRCINEHIEVSGPSAFANVNKPERVVRDDISFRQVPIETLCDWARNNAYPCVVLWTSRTEAQVIPV